VDAEHGTRHILTVVDVCRLRQENLNNGMTVNCEYLLYRYLHVPVPRYRIRNTYMYFIVNFFHAISIRYKTVPYFSLGEKK